jgi:hypothetical protein
MIFNKRATEDEFQYRQDTSDPLTYHYPRSGTIPAGCITRLAGMCLDGQFLCLPLQRRLPTGTRGLAAIECSGEFLKGGGEKVFCVFGLKI